MIEPSKDGTGNIGEKSPFPKGGSSSENSCLVDTDGVGYDICVGDEDRGGSMTGCSEGALLHSVTFDGSL